MTTTVNIFLEATRRKVRFPSHNGMLTVEDLWEIPLVTTSSTKASIENIGAGLLAKQADLEKIQGASILSNLRRSSEKEMVDLQVELLREVARIRQEENAEKTLAAAKASERARLEALIAEREGKELPLDDLRKQRDALG